MKQLLTFNPGPSYLSEDVQNDIVEITQSGLLSVSHRTPLFQEITKGALDGLKRNFNIPDSSKVVFHHSATGAMETILRNFVHTKSGHIVQGAFANRFHQTADQLGLETELKVFPKTAPIPVDTLHFSSDTELICLTHNETSNGSMWPNSALKTLQDNHKDHLICHDLTSSFGGVKIDWELADIWFLSVQKCLGLPSGLGIIILNEQAEARLLNHTLPSWQHLPTMISKMEQFQTVETPNVFLISLLEKQMKRWNSEQIEQQINENYLYLLSHKTLWKPFLNDSDWHSKTVLNLLVDNPSFFHKHAKEHGITLGSGYGDFKTNCIRIANFPSLTKKHFSELINIFKEV